MIVIGGREGMVAKGSGGKIWVCICSLLTHQDKLLTSDLRTPFNIGEAPFLS